MKKPANVESNSLTAFFLESWIQVEGDFARWHWGSVDGRGGSLPFSQPHKATLCRQHSRPIASSGKP